MQPNLFIPGAPKCGTSALASYLATHPSVFLGHVKEPNFWSSDMPFFARREGFHNEAAYSAMYARAPESARYRIDASTHYLYSGVAIPTIAERVPRAKFIVMHRPGAEVAHAWHMQMTIAGYETESNFERAYRMIPERRNGRFVPHNCPEPALLDYRAVASVGTQVERLLRFVRREQVLLMALGDLKEDARKSYLQCLEFLDLPDDGRIEFPVENAAATSRTAGLGRLVRHPGIRPIVNRAMSALSSEQARQLRSTAKKLIYRPQPRQPLSADFRSRLDADFAEDSELLAELASGLVSPSQGNDCKETKETRASLDPQPTVPDARKTG